MSQDALKNENQETIDNTSKKEELPKSAFSPNINDKQQIIAAKETTPSAPKSHDNTPEPVPPINEDNDIISVTSSLSSKEKENDLKKQNIEIDALKMNEETPLLQTSSSKASALFSVTAKKEKLPVVSPAAGSTDLYVPKNNKNNSKWKCCLHFLPGLILAGTGTGLLFVKTNSPVIQGRVNLAGFIILVAGIVATIAPIFCCGSSTSDGNNLEDEPKVGISPSYGSSGND